MTRESLKIGNYTEEEIFQYMTDVEGSMLGRSMYDAIFNTIHALITEKNQLKKDNETLQNSLQTQCQSLQTKIDEAIDYIEGAYEMAIYTKTVSLEEDNIQDLLEILEKAKKFIENDTEMYRI